MVKFFKSKAKKQKEKQNAAAAAIAASKAPPRTSHHNPPPRTSGVNTHHHEDKQAVQYWRAKQDGGGNGLSSTYEISKHPPIHPANGNILHPSVTTPEKKKPLPSTQGASAFERFQPTVQKKGLVMTLSQDEQGFGGRRGEQLQIAGIDHNASFDSRLSGGDPSLFATPPRGAAFAPEGGDNPLSVLNPFECLPQTFQFDKDGIPFGSLGTPATAPLSPMEEEEEEQDHLSDVGSDVSMETKERYLKACRMLKDGLVHKSLHKSDREFLLDLLRDAEATDMEDVMSVEKISLLETAASRLELAPDATAQAPPPAAVAITTTTPTAPAPTTTAPTRKATTKTLKKKLGLSCNPKKADEIQEPTESSFPEQSTPSTFPEQQSRQITQNDDRFFVRFDGWANNVQVEYPFSILGTHNSNELQPRVLTPRMMEAMRGFFPVRVSESNFWLKFSLVRDGASLATLLESIKASQYTIIAVETTHGEVFGSFNGTPWRRATKWFGSGESFLWRLKGSRITTAAQAQEADFENEMEVFPYTGYDDMVQYCTARTIAVGGGDWLDHEFPFENEPQGIGFMLDGDLAGGESSSSATFSNPRLCKKASFSNEFAIGNMEVWTLTPFDNEEDAAGLEMHKLFIESNARRGVV